MSSQNIFSNHRASSDINPKALKIRNFHSFVEHHLSTKIDQVDLGEVRNPQYVSEYAAEIFEFLRLNDSENCPSQGCMEGQ